MKKRTTDHEGNILCIKNSNKKQDQAEAAPLSFAMFWSAVAMQVKMATLGATTTPFIYNSFIGSKRTTP